MTEQRVALSNRSKGLLVAVTTLALSGVVAYEGAFGPSHANAEARSLSAPVASDFVQPSFADMVERVRPAVVSIRVNSTASVSTRSAPDNFGFDEFFRDMPQGHPLERFFREFNERQPNGRQERPRVRRGQGSGFIISADGYVVTNNHVIEDASEVEVIMSDGRTFDAKVIGTDDKTDLALVQIQADNEQFSFVEFADDSRVRVGDWVVAVGNPYGLGGTVTAGIVSARGREIGASIYDDFIQIDAPINRGNSGGPTFNQAGQVVGVNTAIFSPSGGSVGIGFAIPASTADRIIKDLLDDGSVARGWLGVQIQPVTQDIAEGLGLDRAYGALVTTPQDDGPAARAGIEAGDTILAVNGEEIEGPRDLARTIADIEPGSSVELTVWRDGAEVIQKITLGTLPGQRASLIETNPEPIKPAKVDLSDLGLSFGSARNGDGVVIDGIDPNGPAVDAGLKEGDRVLEVAGMSINALRDVERSVQQALEDGRKAVLMRVESRDGVRYVAVPLENI